MELEHGQDGGFKGQRHKSVHGIVRLQAVFGLCVPGKVIGIHTDALDADGRIGHGDADAIRQRVLGHDLAQLPFDLVDGVERHDVRKVLAQSLVADIQLC